jgi:hypothetical protein
MISGKGARSSHFRVFGLLLAPKHLHFPFDQLYGLAGSRSKHNSSSAADTHAQEDNVVVLRIEKPRRYMIAPNSWSAFAPRVTVAFTRIKPEVVRVQE